MTASTSFFMGNHLLGGEGTRTLRHFTCYRNPAKTAVVVQFGKEASQNARLLRPKVRDASRGSPRSPSASLKGRLSPRKECLLKDDNQTAPLRKLLLPLSPLQRVSAERLVQGTGFAGKLSRSSTKPTARGP